MNKQGNEFKVIGLVSMPINNIYEEKDEIAPVIAFEGEGEHSLFYKVDDYFGKTVTEKTVTVSGEGTCVIGFQSKPTRGYYSVYTEIDGVPTGREDLFAVVMNTDERRYYDSFISMDVAGYFLLKSDEEIENYAKALHLAGITHVRERDREHEAHPSPEEYNFSRMDKIIGEFSKYGIRVMPCNHTMPNWARTSKHYLVDDIRVKYDYYKTISQRYDGKADFELWNEPDLDPVSADNMAAVLKAEAIALRDSGADCLSIMPGIAAAPGEYLDLLLQNDLLKYVDTYSFHGHRMASQSDSLDMRKMSVPSSWGRHISNVKRYDIDNLYVYNTEAGISTTMLDGKDYLEINRQKAQARYLPPSMIEGAARGEDKHTYFLVTPYREGLQQWGMFTYTHMPYSSYSALATLTHALGEAKYINCIPDLPKNVRGEVFADGEYRVAAFWSSEETEISVKTDAKDGIHTNIMGTETPICSEDGAFKLTVSPDIVYLRIKGNFNGATERRYPERVFKRHELTRAERVVIEQRYSAEISDLAKLNGYKLSTNGSTPVTVKVTNLNKTPISGKICGRVYDGWKLDCDSQEITLGAFEQKDLTFNITACGEVTAELKTPAVFVGEFDGELSGRSVAHITSNNEGDVQTRPVIDAVNAKNWIRNVLDGSDLEFVNVDDETLEVRCHFAQGDKWLYPRFDLQGGDSFEGTKGLMYDMYLDENEYKTPADMPVTRIFVYENNGSAYYYASGYHGLKAGWNRVKIPWSGLSPSDSGVVDDNFTLDDYEICRISIGINSKKADPNVSYRLRNISVYSAPKDSVYSEIRLNAPIGQSVGENVVIDADIIINETGISEETLTLKVDGKKEVFTYGNGKLRSELSLSAGKHDLVIQFFDETGNIVQSITSFEIK